MSMSLGVDEIANHSFAGTITHEVSHHTNECSSRSDPFNYKKGFFEWVLTIKRVIYARADDDHTLQTIKINKNVRLIVH